MHFISSWQWPHLPCDVVHFNWTAVKGKRACSLASSENNAVPLTTPHTHAQWNSQREKRELRTDWPQMCWREESRARLCAASTRDLATPSQYFPFWPRVNTLWPSFCPFPLKSHSGSQVTAYTVVKIRSRWSWNVCNALFLLAGKKREDSSTDSSMRVLKTCAFIKWGQIWWIYCHR